MFAIKFIRQFSSKMCVAKKKKWISESLIFTFKFPEGRHLEYLWRAIGSPLFFSQGNHDTWQLFKMAAPEKFEK